MVIGVDRPVISFARDFEVCGDFFFLDCEGERVVVLVLVEILIPTVPLHLFEVLDDLVQVSPSDLAEVSGFASLPLKANRGMLVGLVRSF